MLTNKPDSIIALIYIIMAVLTSLLLLIFHSQLADLLISYKANPGESLSEMYIRYHHAVIYGGFGIMLFCLLNAIKHLLKSSKIYAKRLPIYGHMAIEMVSWAVVFVFGDIVIQNISGKSTTFATFSMRYLALGGLIAMEVIVLRNFLIINKKNKSQL